MGNIFILDVSRGWILNAIRTFFMFIDCIVYSVVKTFFKLVFQLSNFELPGFYEIFEERVYVILGIFMLFKVTISLITYLVNPDKINDKEQGAGKVVTRIITVLVMLIALPTFFSLLTEAQNKLLPVIPRIIIGTTNTLSNDDAEGIAKSMSLTMLQGFAHAKKECDISDTSVVLNDSWDLLGAINDPCENNEDIYKYDYFPGLSTVVGIIMLYVLFSLCITVAIRAFKLIILRTIAPIPVISYVDPKSSKDGAFKSWTKMLMSTWTELFMYIGLIYFIVYMIDFLLSSAAYDQFFKQVDNALEGALLLAFIVVGLLFFARQAPKFVFDALGIKNAGSFTKMLGMGAAALGGVGAARAAFRARNEYDDESGRPRRTIRNLGASLFSGLGSAAAGGNAILSTDKPNLMTGFDAQQKYNSNHLNNLHSGISLLNRATARGTSLLSGESPLDNMERQIKAAEAKSTTAKQLKEYMVGEGKKKTANIASTINVDGIDYDLSLDDVNAAINYANSAAGDGYVRFRDSHGIEHAYAANSSVINKLVGDAEEAAGRAYAAKVATGDIDDPGALDAFRKTLADSLGLSDVSALEHYDFNGTTIDLYNDPSQIKKIEKSSQTEAFRIKNSSEYSRAQKIYKKSS